ncbi:hypothetical protein RDI58_006101 [Solanum bulbocastanum]|uniref:Uncharacterized protein n=1 Tax=Solanum bulbocastanum TaxID=147425 RepID=A0AAN8YLK6_SOLBU
MKHQSWRWVLDLVYIITVASIWIAASFVVQSNVNADKYGTFLFWRNKKNQRRLFFLMTMLKQANWLLLMGVNKLLIQMLIWVWMQKGIGYALE